MGRSELETSSATLAAPGVQALFEEALKSQTAGRLAEAIVAYSHLIAIEPNLPGVHSNLGQIFSALGRLDDAERAFRKAISLDPDFDVAYSNLGNVLRDLDRLPEAEAAHRRAIALNPALPEAFSNLGVTLAALAKLDEAEKAYRSAIELKPDFASAYSNLSLLLGELGQLVEARQAARRAVHLAPRNTRFLRNLGWLRKFEAGDPYLLRMEKLVEDAASLSVDSNIELHFTLAKAYEDTGQGERAFRHLVDGNSLKRRFVAYDEAETLRCMKCIEEVFDSRLLQKWQGVGEQTSVPVFIIGMLRSGSTLVEQILASHPMVFGGGELKILSKALVGISAGLDAISAFPLFVPSMSGEQFRSLGESYLSQLKQLAPHAARITDKMPANFLNAGLIHLALPNAKIIHTIRDPVDNCISCFSKLFDEPQPHTYDLAEVGRYYRSYNSLMAHWHRVLPPNRILDVHYEEVVDDLEGAARRIVSHCDLPWDGRCLEFYRTKRPVRTTSAVQVRQPIYKSSVGRGHPYDAVLSPLLKDLSYG
jgi:tetratricopeptide (TPR) repeat protein